jgi:hypothetical protein
MVIVLLMLVRTIRAVAEFPLRATRESTTGPAWPCEVLPSVVDIVDFDLVIRCRRVLQWSPAQIRVELRARRTLALEIMWARKRGRAR